MDTIPPSIMLSARQEISVVNIVRRYSFIIGCGIHFLNVCTLRNVHTLVHITRSDPNKWVTREYLRILLYYIYYIMYIIRLWVAAGDGTCVVYNICERTSASRGNTTILCWSSSRFLVGFRSAQKTFNTVIMYNGKTTHFLVEFFMTLAAVS